MPPRPSRSPDDRTLDVADPIRLRALAHPLRLRLLRLLREHQPATGAQLAELTGESTASISYHLATLAKHGFVEHDPAPGADPAAQAVAHDVRVAAHRVAADRRTSDRESSRA